MSVVITCKLSEAIGVQVRKIRMEATDMFTRGGPNQPDMRGQSMVAKHADKLQKEKEAQALEKLLLLLPRLSPVTHAIALEECEWDAEKALSMLRSFQSEKSVELQEIHKRREQRLLEIAQENDKENSLSASEVSRSMSKSDTSSTSRSTSSESSRDSERSEYESDLDSRERDNGKRDRKEKSRRKRSRSRDRYHRRRRSRRSRSPSHRRQKPEKKRSSHRHERRKRKDGESDEDKIRKHHRKESRDKEKKRRRKSSSNATEKKGKTSKSHSVQEYGKYGIIRETDMYSKNSEFTLWALEVKNVDVDVLPLYEEKELFRTYMEDYNTATLPHRKYYDIAAYEKEKAAKVGKMDDRSLGPRFIDDEAERRKELIMERQKEQQERLRAAYEELKTTDKAEAMRQQDMLRAKMSLAYRTGDQQEAQRLAEKLKPDEQK